jgi:hypothetical protein
MICDHCGAGLRIRWSYTTRKREVWTCPRKGCAGREEITLWPHAAKTRKAEKGGTNGICVSSGALCRVRAAV